MGNTPHKKHNDQKMNSRRLASIVICVLLALALLLPMLSTVLLSAHAVTQDDLKNQISSLKTNAANAAESKKELEQQLKALENDQAKAMERHQILSKQLDALKDQIDNTQSQIDTYTALIAQQEVSLADAQAREEAAYQRFCQRARSMEESGTISYWSVLFSASDFSDLLDRLALVDEIMSYDNKVVDDLADARAQEEAVLADLNESKAGLDEQKAQLDIQRDEQEAKVKEAEGVMADLKAKEEHAEALLEAQLAEEEKIRKQIQAKEKELEDLIAQASFNTGSDYIYPLPSNWVIISSRFGPRTHPITGKYHNHSGTDLPAPGGTPVKACQGGVVTVSAYAQYSYGEYVVINHGNGISTLYAHMTLGSRKVKVGDVVSAGQVIGLVGTTGSSTGNHLHLELQVNGERKDATTLFPNIKFDYRD